MAWLSSLRGNALREVTVAASRGLPNRCRLL
jgi:hypothetical protein